MNTRSRGAPAPQNTSRGAGAPAPASAAATEPGSGGFYSPGDEPAGASSLESGAEAEERDQFNALVRAESPRGGEHFGSADREVVEGLAADAIEDPEALEDEIERIRLIRKPIGPYSLKLALPKRAGYYRHWFNDTAGRVEEARQNGWSPVTGNDGKPISRCVGSGRDKGAMYAFAMEIPEIFWLEDQALKNQAASEKLDSLKRSPFQAPAGAAKATDKGKFYDPSEAEGGPIRTGRDAL